MTNQEIFDKIWERAKTKKKAEVNGLCEYRSKKGKLACFIGYLIPDELYDKRIEENSISSINDKFDDLKSNDSFKQKNIVTRFEEYSKFRYVQTEKSRDGEVSLLKILLNGLKIKVTQLKFLEELQTIHDNCDTKDWEEELVLVAKGHRLKVPKNLN